MQMQERPIRLAIIACILTYAPVAGYFGAIQTKLPSALQVIPFFWLPAAYCWYYVDAQQRGYKRTTAMGASIVLFCLFAIPFYLARSRPIGARWSSVRKYIGLVIGYFFLAIIGGFAADLVNQP